VGFLYKDTNIKDRRVKTAIDTMYKSMTDLLILEEQAAVLIDEPTESAWIAAHSTNPGETAPLLPIGNEKVLNWNTLGFDLVSNSKFIEMVFNQVSATYDRNTLDVLEPDYKIAGEVLPTGTTALTETGLKIKDGKIILKNLEKYDYDFKSYELLNETFRALVIFLDSVEEFYAEFYQQSVFDFIDVPYNTYDDSAAEDRVILVYDTRAMDWKIENIVDPIADQILDIDDREAVKLKYRTLRDTIKYWTMDTAVYRIEDDIDDLLLCVNGKKKYDISVNIELRELQLIQDAFGYTRRIQKGEEVWFPFHNKAILESFSEGLSSVW